MDGDLSNSLMNVVTTLQAANQNMSRLITTIESILPRVTGTFTLAAAASTVVPDVNVTSTSFVQLTPLNASAGTLQGSSACLYLSARTAGTSFTVSTASGASAAGTEQFQYTIMNLV